MASLDPDFHQETRSLHREHEELLAQLDQLDASLEQIVCYTEVFIDLATANQAIARGKWMAEWLPRHHAHEETTVLEMIARMSPELGSFTREMKRQHNEMRLRLERFRDHISHIRGQRDVEAAVAELKREGKDLTRMMRLHIAAEEKKFSGLEDSN
jgi:hemerythrin-like domain-containing protein